MCKLPQKTYYFSIALACCHLAGCGKGPSFAPVSGVVTLNGKPHPGAIVTFQPIATPENTNPGRGSSGQTDEVGKFQLTSDDGQEGAVVGRHVVRIITPWNEATGGFDLSNGTPDGIVEPNVKIEVDPIPLEWNAESDKEFEVPPKGTDAADFHIVSTRR